MHNPPAFRETRPEALAAAMAAIGLATLVTRGSGGLTATHLPLLHDPEPAPCGRLTERHEAGADIPWRVEDAPAAFLAGQLKGIVGIELTIARLEGKWKMSQNRPPADREGVIGGLERRGEAGDAAVAEVMRGRGARGRGC